MYNQTPALFRREDLVRTLKMQKKRLNSPDEIRSFEKGKVELVNFENVIIGRAVLNQDGFGIKICQTYPKTNRCEAPHTSVIISGSMKVRTDDVTEAECGPSDSAVRLPGHNAWIVEDEPCVMIDFTGAKDYAKKT
jgi:hypothetical protein